MSARNQKQNPVTPDTLLLTCRLVPRALDARRASEDFSGFEFAKRIPLPRIWRLFSWAKSHGAVIRDGWKALQALDRCDRTCQAVHDLPEGERAESGERVGGQELVPE